MTDPILDPYWEAVKLEHYQKHLRQLHQHLDRKTKRVISAPKRLAWGLAMLFGLVLAGFIPVGDTETTGFIIAGRTESLGMSDTFGALETLPFSGQHNLSVSADTLGTTFALFLPNNDSLSAETWMARVEGVVNPTELRIQTIDIVTNRALWERLIARAGVSISASGSTREEIQAQVDRQLKALGSGSAEVEQVTGPDGQNSIRIIIRDME
ncbi:MAG: hypothetical protein AB8G77_20480 [Rhodothermales bacterium]